MTLPPPQSQGTSLQPCTVPVGQLVALCYQSLSDSSSLVTLLPALGHVHCSLLLVGAGTGKAGRGGAVKCHSLHGVPAHARVFFLPTTMLVHLHGDVVLANFMTI